MTDHNVLATAGSGAADVAQPDASAARTDRRAEGTASHRSETRFPLFAVLVFAFTGFLSLTTELLPSGLLTLIAPDLHVSVAMAGAVTTAYAVGVVVTVLPLTRLALKLRRRTALVLTVLLFVLSNLIVVFAPNLTVSLVGRFLGGAAHGLVWALLPAVVERFAGPLHARRAMTIVFTGNSLGLAAGAPLSSLLGTSLGWRIAFGVMAAAALVTALLLLRIVPHIHVQEGPHMPLLKAARLPGAMRVIVGWALVMLGHFGVLTYIAPYLERLGVGAGVVSLSLAVLGCAGIVGVMLIGRLGARSLLVGLITAPVLIFVALALLLVAPPTLPVVFVLLVVWGMGFSGTVLLYQQAVLVTGRRAPETVTSISVLVSQLGIALGASAGGVTVSTLGLGTLPVIGLVFVAAALLLLPGLRPALRQAREEA
ncbi:MFS transporter [Streptomyces sp. AcE210]|uniref:MFS transporter n=1 Tax=Streptomyces sp. AcE210 TaxID=2292703 RepID=UPI000E308027|nr:MFS transporter [Streptomyces sp. AcE210]RFC77529.1 MFS transporter [Streptomyces sp. AcE210]